jgi:hypothetical protein
MAEQDDPLIHLARIFAAGQLVKRTDGQDEAVATDRAHAEFVARESLKPRDDAQRRRRDRRTLH